MRLLIVAACTGLLTLLGCPKPGDQATETNVTITDENVTALSETPAQAEGSAESTPDNDRAEESNGASKDDGAHRPSKDELQGKWFALYGGAGQGAKTYTFENGHQLEFLSSGIAMWTVTGDGGRGLQLASNWDVASGEITLTVDKPGELTNPGVGETPLGFGRDDEVGLTSGGGGGEAAQQAVVFRYTPKMAGGFLALEGRRGELMVYGRVTNSAPGNAPDVSGKWQLALPGGQSTDATVNASGNDLQVKWGNPPSTFLGAYTNGYYVGTVESTTGIAYATLTPVPGGTLDGVISAEPFSRFETSFDLTRASQ